MIHMDRTQIWRQLKIEASRYAFENTEDKLHRISSLLHQYYESLPPEAQKIKVYIMTQEGTFAVERGQIPRLFDTDEKWRHRILQYLSTLAAATNTT